MARRTLAADQVRRQLLAAWGGARTLSDLGELTAQWLEGELSGGPWQDGPFDNETHPLVPVLARLNRAGLVTTNSQPGTGPSEEDGVQRAWVSLLTTWEASRQLEDATYNTDLVLTSHVATEHGYIPSAIAVTAWPGRQDDGAWPWSSSLVHTRVGGCGPPSSLCLDGLSDEMNRLFDDCAQIDLLDPVWGRRHYLWDFLDRFLDAYEPPDLPSPIRR